MDQGHFLAAKQLLQQWIFVNISLVPKKINLSLVIQRNLIKIIIF